MRVAHSGAPLTASIGEQCAKPVVSRFAEVGPFECPLCDRRKLPGACAFWNHLRYKHTPGELQARSSTLGDDAMEAALVSDREQHEPR